MTEPGHSQPGWITAANQAAYRHIVDIWAEKWDAQDEQYHGPVRDLLLKHCPGKKILDIGCGLGRDSLFFASRGYDVTATDIVDGFLPGIRENNPEVRVAVR